MLKIQGLSKTYGKIKGAEDITFSLNEHEVVGFIGPNGAGKSTTMNMIAGCLAPTSGDAAADGFFMSENPVAFKKKIGYLPEQPPLYHELTVQEYLEIVFKIKKVTLDRAEHLDEIVEKFGLTGVRNRVIGNLSKGYRQRIGLAQAFVGKPSYVILDEPTVGLDPNQKKKTLELIKKMSKGCGILLSSHILSEIAFVCDRVLIINEGRIVKEVKSADEKNSVYLYRVAGDSKEIIKTFLSVEGVVSAVKKDNGYLVETAETALDAIFYQLAKKQFSITGLELYRIDVEEEFTRAIAKQERRKSS